MKKNILFTTLLLITALAVNAQNDTLYIMKSGFITGVYKVSEVDSLIFYKPKETVTDADGNVYNTVKIGNQVWMKENLKTTTYNDGTPITNITTDNTAWSNNTTGAYCWYNNDPNQYKNPYGALYNWYAVNTGKLCPTGWHVPTDAEWNTLIQSIDPNADPNVEGIQSATAGDKMKSTGTQYWTAPNQGATNESGFSGFPGGYRVNSSNFGEILYNGYWWSSSKPNFSSNAWLRMLVYLNGEVYRTIQQNTTGVSVRCVRD